MKKPLHQVIFESTLLILAGLLALGTFLDAIGNAVTLVTPLIAGVGTLLLALTWISAQIILRYHPVSWVAKNGATVKIRKLGVGYSLPFLGMILLLWLPLLVGQGSSAQDSDREARIAQFASELSDSDKRNTSAYAFALFAGEDALPLLISELVSTAKFDDDKRYQDALIRSLIQVGDSALLPVLDINRQAFILNDEQNKRVILATQPFLYHYLQNKKDVLIGKDRILKGVQINGLDFFGKDFTDIDFSGTAFISTKLCLAKLTNGNFASLSFSNSDLGGANFTNSHIGWITLDETTPAVEAHFDSSWVEGDFQGAHLPHTTWRGTHIFHSYLEVGLLDYANFDNAVITYTHFTFSSMYSASFKNAQLTGNSFSGTDLEKADFSGAKFDESRSPFFLDTDELPNLIVTTREHKIYGTGSAFVRGANFEGAKGLNEESRIYLCTWGAVNVPGGCAGIQVRVSDMSIVPANRSTQYEWCY